MLPGAGIQEGAIRGVEAAMAEIQRESELIVAGDFNIDMEGTDGQGQDEEIVEAISTAGLVGHEGHFLPQRQAWCKDRRTWDMTRQGRVVQYQTDYILESDRQIFHNMAARDPRHNSDHLMVIGFLRSASPR